jgi:hypothetical protein
MTTGDERQAAVGHIDELVALLKRQPEAGMAAIVDECEALSRAVRAFHMEGIRFRIYNVDRLLVRHPELPAEARTLLEETRKHLEAAGFHTRSHQSPV